MSSEWRSYRLDEVGRIVTGKTPKGNVAEYVGTDVPFVTPPDFDGSKWIYDTARRISTAGALSVKNNIVPPGSVLVTCIGSDMGKAALTESACVTNQQINAVVVDQEKFCPEFLYYNLSLRKDEIRGLAGGSAQPILNKTAFGQVRFDCPPLAQQKAISAAFGPLDDRITLLRETNATLEAIAQALFKSWFVDFDPVRAKAEGLQPEGMDAPTAALFPDSFEESELGLVPKGWQVGPVGDFVQVVDYVANGSFASLKENVTLLDSPSFALYVRTTDYNSGFSGSFRYVDKQAYDFLSKSSLKGNEVLISNVGDVGTVFRAPSWLGMPMTLGSNAVALKAPEFSGFLFFYFKGEKGQHDIQSVVTGSAQLKFNKTNFRSLRISIPEISVLQRFESVSGEILNKIDNNLAQAKTLTQLRDTLLPRLISGQLCLPEVEQAVEEALA